MRFLASFLAGAATAITLVLAAPGNARAATDQPPFLDVVQAFPGQARVDDAGRGPLLVQFDVPPGYHLYRERFAIEAEGTALPAPQLPEGKAEFDPNFNKTMTLWAGAVRIAQPLPTGALPASLTVRFQGCADRGLCYPPQQALVHLTRGGDGAVTARWESQPDALTAPVDEPSTSAAPAASRARISSPTIPPVCSAASSFRSAA